MLKRSENCIFHKKEDMCFRNQQPSWSLWRIFLSFVGGANTGSCWRASTTLRILPWASTSWPFSPFCSGARWALMSWYRTSLVNFNLYRKDFFKKPKGRKQKCSIKKKKFKDQTSSSMQSKENHIQNRETMNRIHLGNIWMRIFHHSRQEIRSSWVVHSRISYNPRSRAQKQFCPILEAHLFIKKNESTKKGARFPLLIFTWEGKNEKKTICWHG